LLHHSAGCPAHTRFIVSNLNMLYRLFRQILSPAEQGSEIEDQQALLHLLYTHTLALQDSWAPSNELAAMMVWRTRAPVGYLPKKLR